MWTLTRFVVPSPRIVRRALRESTRNALLLIIPFLSFVSLSLSSGHTYMTNIYIPATQCTIRHASISQNGQQWSWSSLRSLIWRSRTVNANPSAWKCQRTGGEFRWHRWIRKETEDQFTLGLNRWRTRFSRPTTRLWSQWNSSEIVQELLSSDVRSDARCDIDYSDYLCCSLVCSNILPVGFPIVRIPS